MVTTRSSTRGASVPPADVAKPPTRARASKAAHAAFTHTPTRLTLAWLAISCAVVTWDFTYVFLRPHSMPGGALHAFWAPYALYGEIDYVYGRPAFDAGEGFGPAQSAMNVVETLMYLVYLAAMHRGSGKLSGQHGKVVLLVAFSAAVMTLSKTVLYWANEFFSGFSNIGHNKISDLIVLWIIPK
ncbi:hypothetical protein CFO_g4738 [Ceratocystis platani]|uniref:C6 transcription factor n=1 Tax=Ceratocystis fimbriata f. sp. platani TaxID=88771 RepID=A0A0F8AXN8_CERFI|nr:hypothetical protein CFO_g4738 [Ceratocystis platani]